MNDDELNKLLGISQADQMEASAVPFAATVAKVVLAYYQQLCEDGMEPDAVLELTGKFQTSYFSMISSMVAMQNLMNQQKGGA